MSTISPQGYSYGQDPKSDNPFWSDEEVNEQITATASVDNSTGTPSVDVTKNGFNFDFAFKNLKGEKGDRGEQGEPGKDGTDGINGTNGTNGTDGTNGISPVVTATGNTGSGELAGTITGADQTVINVYNGAQGETGSGTSVDTSQFVTDVSVVNTNGVYDIKQTKNGVQSDVGQIDVPDTTNLLAEVTDSVVENATNGYDFHTIKETENNGTQNDVGKFYIARKQITALNEDGSFTTVDQAGNEASGKLNISSSGGSSFTLEVTAGTKELMASTENYIFSTYMSNKENFVGGMLFEDPTDSTKKTLLLPKIINLGKYVYAEATLDDCLWKTALGTKSVSKTSYFESVSISGSITMRIPTGEIYTSDSGLVSITRTEYARPLLEITFYDSTTTSITPNDTTSNVISLEALVNGETQTVTLACIYSEDSSNTSNYTVTFYLMGFDVTLPCQVNSLTSDGSFEDVNVTIS